MSSVKIETSREQLLPTVAMIREEVTALEAQIARLEQENAHSPVLLQMLRKWLVFGPTKKLEWTRFKLKLKQKELPSSDTSYNEPRKAFTY